MARKKSRSTGSKLQPAITDLSFSTKTGVNASDKYYIDTMSELSKVNRRLYSQAMMVGFQGLTFIWRPSSGTSVPPQATDLGTIEVTVRTAGNSWIVQNAHVKGHALWNEMQDLVLDDNPSVRTKWHDFKVTFSTDQTGTAAAGNTLLTQDADGNDVMGGEWNYSTYVMPQHEVDPATGLPLPAEEFDACLIGDDNVSRRSLVKAYQQSRSTVSPDQPNSPVALPDSFFSLLTDSGSQEPELAAVVQDENENPPYALDDYPQGAINAPTAVPVGYGAISASEVDGRIGGFVAPCGLLEIEVAGYDYSGAQVSASALPEIQMLLHVAPGMYKGIAAKKMGQ